MRPLILTLGLVLASCSHVKTDALTADEHRTEAQVHLEKAREAEEKVDPTDTTRPAARGPGSPVFGAVDGHFAPYNPSDVHLQEADRELEKANAHLAAAKTLETFEDKACEGLSAGERSSCPLFASSVKRVEWVKDGFKLVMKDPNQTAPTFARLRCHLAYAVASGFDRPSCPLFLKGTKLSEEGGTSIIFSSESAEVAEALRAQARRVFPAPAMRPVSNR